MQQLLRLCVLVKLIEKLYDLVAQTEIEAIMEKVRKELGFAPEDYKIKRVWATRNVNAIASKRGKLTEIVVNNY